MADLSGIIVPPARKVAQNPNAMPLIGSIPTAPSATNSGRAVAMNPIAVPPVIDIPKAPAVSAYQPVSAATNAYQEAGDPFTAFAQGWTNASSARDSLAQEAAEKLKAEAEAQAIRDTTAEMLADHPDLARLVQINGLQPEQALERKEQREQAAAALSSEDGEKQTTYDYLISIDRPDLAEPFKAGVYDYDQVAEILTAENEPKTNSEPPRVETRYNEETGREEKVQWNPASGGWEPFGGTKAAPAEGEEGFNVSQGAAALYADRMAIADSIISKPGISTVQTDRWQQGLNSVPFVGNDLTSPEFQQASQAQRDFINATLRRESGAVISGEEFANAEQQYFPRPGDTPEVLAQKAANRKVAINGIARQAGPAYKAPTIPTLTPEGVVEPTVNQEEVAQPQTEAEYNALPSGALFIDPDDGQQYQKP